MICLDLMVKFFHAKCETIDNLLIDYIIYSGCINHRYNNNIANSYAKTGYRIDEYRPDEI